MSLFSQCSFIHHIIDTHPAISLVTQVQNLWSTLTSPSSSLPLQCSCELFSPFHFHKTWPIIWGPHHLHHALLLQWPKWFLWYASYPPNHHVARVRVKQVWLGHNCLMRKRPKSPLDKIICLALYASISSTNIPLSLSTYHWLVPPFIYFDYILHPKYGSIVSYLPWWHYIPYSFFKHLRTYRVGNYYLHQNQNQSPSQMPHILLCLY